MLTKKYIILSLLTIGLLIDIFSVVHKSKTIDENAHLRYGIQMLHLNSNRFDDSKMPFSILNAIPYCIAIHSIDYSHGFFYNLATKIAGFNRKLPNSKIRAYIGIMAGRIGTILFSLITAFFVFKWSNELYGLSAGYLSVFLYIFSPNIIANSQLITTDIFAAGMATIATYYFWRFIRSESRKDFILSAFTLGLAQLAKYSCVFLYIIFIIIVIIKNINRIFNMIRNNEFKKILIMVKKSFLYGFYFLVISLFIINIGFLFNKSFTPLKEYKFKSRLFREVQSLTIIKNIPVPVPYPYLEGLDWVKFREDTGNGYGNIYLLGKLHTKNIRFEGFNGYYFYAMLFKVPISIQILFFLSFILYILNRRKYNFINNELFIFCPIVFYLIFFNFFMNAQIGIRHIIIIFPLMFIFCGSFINDWNKINLWRKVTVAILSIYLVFSVMSYSPHFLSYFNEIVWNRTQAYKYLADSNIDWGQNQWYLRKYLEKHPDVIVNPKYPVSGEIVVSVNKLVGIYNPSQYKWLRKNFKPVGQIAYSYLIYDVTKYDLRKLKLEKKEHEKS